ncbi:MAG TPA: YigZ family protein [Candidatus Limnocylindria bacterium]|nr:YigZ family protein [Candidatus Limnocylindria bacterium]
MKKSRFIAGAAPAADEAAALAFIEDIRGSHKAASHHCYAYILGAQGNALRYSDDGEPQGTAGLPILEAMRKPGLTNCVCVVTRYFGGVLLGAPGLVRAYGQAASMAVRAAGTARWESSQAIAADVSYDRWDRVRHSLIRLGAQAPEATFTDKIRFETVMRACDTEKALAELAALTDGAISPEVSPPFYKPWPQPGASE